MNGNAPAGDVNTLDPHYKPERTDNFTFTLQRELSKKMTLETGYIGRIIKNEFQEINLDAVPYMMTVGGQAFSQAYANVYTAIANGQSPASLPAQPFYETALGGANSAYCKAFANCTAAVASGNTSAFRNTQVSDIWAAMNRASSWTLGRTMISSLPSQMTSMGLTTSLGYGNYNALFVTWRARDYHGLTAVSNFTWGRSMGTAPLGQSSSGATATDPFNIPAMYGANGYDIKFLYNLAMYYQAPYYRTQKGVLGRVLGGWTFSPLFTAQTGSLTAVGYTEGGCSACQAFGEATPPASVSSVAEDAVGTGVPFTGGNSRHNNIAGSNGIGTNNPFGVNMFTDPAAVYAEFRRCVLGIDTSCGGYGNLRSLPTWNVDASVIKDIGIWKEGRVGATLHFQFTNVLNHFQPGAPSLSLTTPTSFGRITTQGNTPRNMEFGLRIHF